MKDLIILGNGMAGMTAALYASRANLDFKIVGRDEYDFGQISNAVLVENFPCVEPMSGFDLAMKLHDQLESNGIKIEEHEVEAVFPAKRTICSPRSPFIIKYADGTQETAKTIIYALGARHRELNCKTQGDVQIHYCALCDGPLYKDKSVAVIGGGDVAFTQAEYLSKICKDVYIVMCDQNVTAAPATFDRVSKLHNVHIWYDAPVTSISKDSEGTCWIQCKGVRGPLFAEGVFVAIGMIPNTAPIDMYDVVNKDGYIAARDTGVSPAPGFFAAGDARTKTTRQALTAASDGANAVQSVIEYLKQYKE